MRSPSCRSRPLPKPSCSGMSSQPPALSWTPYTFATRFEGKQGTNPEELIAAAHAACLSMALSAGLEKAGKPVTRVETTAACTMDMVNGAPTITKMALSVRGKVPGLDQAGFQKAAEEAKRGCPVSQALAGIPQITLDAKL